MIPTLVKIVLSLYHINFQLPSWKIVERSNRYVVINIHILSLISWMQMVKNQVENFAKAKKWSSSALVEISYYLVINLLWPTCGL